MNIERNHPSYNKHKIEVRQVYAESGSLLIMKGREVWHTSEPTINEEKRVVVFNYYENGDTWRPKKFDDFVYDGIKVI